MRKEEFLEKLQKIEDIDKATDFIFEEFDDLFWAGEFQECDEILASINLETLDPTLSMAFLTITLAAKSKLLQRQAFYDKVEEIFLAQRGEEKTKRLLGGLE